MSPEKVAQEKLEARRKKQSGYNKRYRLKHLEVLREKESAWRADNPEKVKETDARWRSRNRKVAYERSRKWGKKHPEKCRVSRRESERKSIEELSDRYIAKVLGLSLKSIKQHPDLIESQRTVILLKRLAGKTPRRIKSSPEATENKKNKP